MYAGKDLNINIKMTTTFVTVIFSIVSYIAFYMSVVVLTSLILKNLHTKLWIRPYFYSYIQSCTCPAELSVKLQLIGRSSSQLLK